MTTVRITYYGMDGDGKNLTEAKRDAGRKIEQALSGYWTPTILAHRGHAILIYRTPDGWLWRGITDDAGAVKAGPVHGGGPYASQKEAESTAKQHLAQLGWKPGDGTESPEILTGLDRHTQADFRSWAEFQARFVEARARGMCDGDAHDYAGRNPARPDLWAVPA